MPSTSSSIMPTATPTSMPPGPFQTPRRTGPVTRAAARKQLLAGSASASASASAFYSASTNTPSAASPYTPAQASKEKEKENMRPMTTTAASRRRGKADVKRDLDVDVDGFGTPSKPMGRRVTRATRGRKAVVADVDAEVKKEEEKEEEKEEVKREEEGEGDGDEVNEEVETKEETKEEESTTAEQQPASDSKHEAEEEADQQSSLLSPPPQETTTSTSTSPSPLSRSPSPAGLIPLHERYRRFIHRHEIPRKLLHLSIGFLTLNFYRLGIQTHQITPYLMSALLPIATLDFIRHRSAYFNHLYIQCVGALMRECEVNGYNGVIWYLLGAWTVLYAFPKDVGVMGVLLLSWCDTAASTFGRAWGRYTPKLRDGKSLAGTAAAFVVGVVTAAAFWGWFVPAVGSFEGDAEGAYMFGGRLCGVPSFMREEGVCEERGRMVITGYAALGVVSVWTGLVAAVSELVDVFGWDDNLTIPVLSGLGIWGFLRVFG